MPITYGYQRDIMFNRVRAVPNFNRIEIISVIFCSLRIERDRLKEKILNGTLELESSGNTNYLVLDGTLTFEKSVINDNIIKGKTTISKEIEDRVLFNGNLTYEPSDSFAANILISDRALIPPILQLYFLVISLR